MSKHALGLKLIRLAAWSEIIISVLVDGVLYRSAHMENPRWLPHAKLHCAMSFHASIALGIGALLVLRSRRGRLERVDTAIAAFLGCAFWISLLTARLWPGTSFTFADDPAFADQKPWHVLGVDLVPNAVLAALLVIMAVVGYLLSTSSERQTPARTSP